MKYILLSFCFLFTVAASAQVKTAPKEKEWDDKDSVYTVFDEKPYPPYDMGKYLGDNLQYPYSARKNNTEGRVIVRFVVKKNGEIAKCKVTTSVSPDLDKEALRVVRSMPPWKPGKIKGKAVKVWFALPIVYKLED